MRLLAGHEVLWVCTDRAGHQEKNPVSPENLKPLVRALVEAKATWVGHISIITADGIQTLAAGEQ